jgi:hypothetical protein
MTTQDPRQNKEKVSVRQGTKEKMNIRVLATSMVLIAIIFAGLYFFFLSKPHSENRGAEPTAGQSTPQQNSPPAVAP